MAAVGCRRRMQGVQVVMSTITLIWLCMLPLMCGARALDHVVVQQQHDHEQLSRVHNINIDSSCPPEFTYVYPYASHCSQPARFFTEEFQLYYETTSAISGLEPEWDEANSTYYLRLTASFSSASYTVLYNLSAAGGLVVENVYQNFPSLLQNTESKRYLAWREEGDGEYFLIETNTFDEAATFWFVQDAKLPCIFLPGARCEAYNLRSVPRDRIQAAAGWLLYEESGVNHIKLGPPSSIGQVPIVLARISTVVGATRASSSVIRTPTSTN